METLRTMHDIRTARSVATRAMPTGEGATYLQLHRLASEKLRLEREIELWRRKQERIEKRLGEIAGQMEGLRRGNPTVVVESHVKSPKKTLHQEILEY